VTALGKLLLIAGLLIAGLGLWLIFGPRPPWPFLRLPGDILIQKEKFTFFFPMTTCILLSILITFLSYLFFRR